MVQNSSIEWTDHTFNPWVGCTNVSPGCDHCYAEAWAKHTGLVSWGNNPRRRTSDSYWRSPMRRESHATAFFVKYGRRQRVFCASLADVFDNKVDGAWRSGLFGLIRSTPSLDWLLLTKRPQNIAKMLPRDWLEGQLLNVWLGITAENQRYSDQRWPILASVPAAVRFVSYEPALGALRLQDDVVQPD